MFLTVAEFHILKAKQLHNKLIPLFLYLLSLPTGSVSGTPGATISYRVLCVDSRTVGRLPVLQSLKTDRQTSAHVHIHIYGQFRVSIRPDLCIFAVWEDTRENPHKGANCAQERLEPGFSSCETMVKVMYERAGSGLKHHCAKLKTKDGTPGSE